MASLLISDIEDTVLGQLQQRADSNGRTPEAEAKVILEGALQGSLAPAWKQANAFRNQLAASGRMFGDSTELLREDRER